MACGEAIVCAGPSGTGFFLLFAACQSGAGWRVPCCRAIKTPLYPPFVDKRGDGISPPTLPTIPGRRETKGNLNFSSCPPRGQLPGLVAGAAPLVVAGAGVAGAAGGKRSLGMGLISILARFRSSVSRFF